ncbi:DMT family transporter [Patescibacteria group bacterium]|nr:DMT family transporter [Patescibacteria group bacterium]
MNKKGLLLVFSTAVISGFSIFINKFGVSLADPYVFAFLKNVIVALALTGLVLFLKNRAALRGLKPKQWLLLVLIGLIGGSIPFLLFFKGLALTSAAQGSFIQKTMFIYVTAMAVVFLKEKLSKNFLIGALLLLLGNTLLLKTLNFSFGYGDLLILLATLFWATENIISKYTLKDMPAKTVAWGRMFFGSIFILGFLGVSGRIDSIVVLNFGQISWVLITAAILLGYVVSWYNGLKYIPVSVACAILLLGSPITTLLAAISAGKINFQEILSGLLILSGLTVIIGASYLWKKIIKMRSLISWSHPER